jgi:hypothetical protein
VAGDLSISLPAGLRAAFVGAPRRHWRYISDALGRSPEPDARRADLTVRFVSRLPRLGRAWRIGELGGWTDERFWVGDLRGHRLEWSPEAPLRGEWRCERKFAPDALWAYLWWALRAAWRERGTVLLHASAVAWQGRGLALMGWSGAGKTMALRELLRRGAAFLGDDWIAVSPRGIERCGAQIRTAGGRRAVSRALPGTAVLDTAPLSAVCLLMTTECPSTGGLPPETPGSAGLQTGDVADPEVGAASPVQEAGTVQRRPWDARDAALRMAACLRHEGTPFAIACDAYRYFRPRAATPFDDAEQNDAALLAGLFASTRGSAWSVPIRTDPALLVDRLLAWIEADECALQGRVNRNISTTGKPW